MGKNGLGNNCFNDAPACVLFAQTTPQPPASWVAFKQAEHAKQVAFFAQLKADRDAFLRSNPEVKSYLAQLHAANMARETVHGRPHINEESSQTLIFLKLVGHKKVPLVVRATWASMSLLPLESISTMSPRAWARDPASMSFNVAKK